jgi:hypothetical protein
MAVNEEDTNQRMALAIGTHQLRTPNSRRKQGNQIWEPKRSQQQSLPPMQTHQEGCKIWILHHPPPAESKAHPRPALSPMNIQNQNKINKMGKIIDKERLTHGQSYK